MNKMNRIIRKGLAYYFLLCIIISSTTDIICADSGSGFQSRGASVSGSWMPSDIANSRASELNSSVQYNDDETVRQVQEALSTAGYSCTVDGKYGPNTAGQISEYERTNGLNEDGIITDKLLSSLNITPSEDAKERAEKAAYSTAYSWEELARNPSDYNGVKVKYSGRIVQSDPSERYVGDVWARVAINDNIDTVIYLEIPSAKLNGRLLENDYVTVYGKAKGMKTYTAVLGQSITIPKIDVDYIDVN